MTPAPTGERPEMMTDRITLCGELIKAICRAGDHGFLPAAVLLPLNALTESYETALAEKTAEVERLQQREREALDAHAASFGALAAISRLTALGGEVDEYDDVTKAVEVALAAAQADSRRLDWLEARMVEAGDKTVRIEASEFDRTFRVYGTPRHVRDADLRAALDHAMTQERDNV